MKEREVRDRACVAAAHVAIADPAPEALRVCEVASPREGGSLADKLFKTGDYQHAGACYQAAGNMAHANLALLYAVGPESEELLEHSRHSETPRNHYLPRLSTRFAAIIDLPSPRVRSAQPRETGTCRSQQPQHAAGQHRADRLIS